jgi:hypothetical protein
METLITKDITKALDAYLEEAGKEFIGAVEANEILARKRISIH